MLPRQTQAGYEPDGTGVNHSQTNCSNKSRAVVVTLDFLPHMTKYKENTQITIKVSFTSKSYK